ncbi:MAG: selenium-dependent molybdenum cofactor biosynthesis protein YqeB [Anaerolineae bacterium]
MLFPNHLVLIRGGGDLATGVAYRLHQAGFPIIVTELARPLVVRRTVALATAVLQGEIQIENLHGQRVQTPAEALKLASTGIIPVLIAPDLSSFILHPSSFPILVDARVAKRNIDTTIEQAELVIALGPGYCAGVDCHAVIETMRGHTLGRVIWQGAALPNTGTPGIVAGKGAERVLRAPVAGIVDWRLEIGDWVAAGEVMGDVAGEPVRAPFAGVVRGLIAGGTAVPANLKIGDVDARADREACFTISDKALAVGGGVLEAVLKWLNERERDAG